MKQTKHFKRTALPLSAKSMLGTLLLLIAMLMPQGAWAENFISEVKYGVHSKQDNAKGYLSGYTIIDNDFNNGTKGDWVYIGYKTSTNAADAITGLLVVVNDPESTSTTYGDSGFKFGGAKTMMVDGKRYYLAEYGGNADMNNGNDTHRNRVYLYYTKDGNTTNGAQLITTLGAYRGELTTNTTGKNVVPLYGGNGTATNGTYLLSKLSEFGDTNKGGGGSFNYITYTTHTHAYTAAFNWASDGKTCTADIDCTCGDKHTGIACTVTSAVKTAASCVMGWTTYTAKVTSNGKDFSDTKDVQDIAAIGGHGSEGYIDYVNWYSQNSTWDNPICLFSLTCKKCGTKIFDNESLKCTEVESLQRRCDSDGYYVYQVTVSYKSTISAWDYKLTNQKRYTVPSTGHGAKGYTEEYLWAGRVYNDPTQDAPVCQFSLRCEDCKKKVITFQDLETTKIEHKDAICQTGYTVYQASGSYTPSKGHSYSSTSTHKYIINPIHDFTSMIATPTYHKDDATCDVAATYWYKCSRCDAKSTTNYYASVEDKDKAIGHDYSSKTTTEPYLREPSNCTTEPASYWYKCTRCEAKSPTNYYASTEDKDKPCHKYATEQLVNPTAENSKGNWQVSNGGNVAWRPTEIQFGEWYNSINQTIAINPNDVDKPLTVSCDYQIVNSGSFGGSADIYVELLDENEVVVRKHNLLSWQGANYEMSSPKTVSKEIQLTADTRAVKMTIGGKAQKNADVGPIFSNMSIKFTTSEELKAPTCSEKGEKAYKCLACGHLVKEEIETIDHNYDTVELLVNPTSTSDKGNWNVENALISREKDGFQFYVDYNIADQTVAINPTDVDKPLTVSCDYLIDTPASDFTGRADIYVELLDNNKNVLNKYYLLNWSGINYQMSSPRRLSKIIKMPVDTRYVKMTIGGNSQEKYYGYASGPKFTNMSLRLATKPVVLKESTCAEKGEIGHRCTVCGYKKIEEEIATIPHVFTGKTLTASPAEDGLYAYACDNGCGQGDEHRFIKDFNGAGNHLELTTDGEGNYSTSENITLADANGFVSPVDFTANRVTYTRNNIKNQWGTIVVPFDVTGSDKYDFYTLTSATNEELTLTKVNGTLAAGTPALVRINTELGTDQTYDLELNSAEGTVTVNADVENGSSADGLTLTGSYSVKDITSENGYIISNNKFWSIKDIKGSNNVYCAPFRAYLQGTLANSPQMLNISWEEATPTVIETLEAITSGEAEIYDLNGRRITELRPGANIVKSANGTTRKVFIK